MNRARVLAVASVLALGACSGGNSAPVNEGCPLTMIAPPPVLYPSSSPPLASAGGFNIVVAYLYGQYPLTLQAPGAATVATGAAIVPAPTPLPGGAPTPPPGATPVAYAVPAGSLQPGATYAIVAELTFSGDCPTQRPTLGTFTTAQ